MKKILYVSVHSEGFGDGVANLRYISSLKQFVNEPVISHGLIHRKSSNLYSFLIEDMGLMDKIYTHDSIDNFEIILTSELKNIKYDYIFLSEIGENFLTNCEHYINVLNNILNKDGMIYYMNDEYKKYFSKLPQYGNNLKNYISVLKDFPVGLISDNNFDYDTNYFLSKSEGKKIMCIFPNSTRQFANISEILTEKIIDYFIKENYFVYLCGEFFNCYESNSYEEKPWIDWQKINESLEQKFITTNSFSNISGLSLKKQLKILKTSDVVIAAPTGICMLFYYIKIEKPNFCILNLGDSRIMEDIYNGLNTNLLFKNKIHFINTTCEFFPCDLNRWTMNNISVNVNNCRVNLVGNCMTEDHYLEQIKKLI